MFKGSIRKHLLTLVFTMAVFFLMGTAALAANYTTLEGMLTGKAGDTFTLTGTSSGSNFTVSNTETQSFEMAKYVKQGMVSGANTVKSVDYQASQIVISFSSTVSGTSLSMNIPDNIAASKREHDNNQANSQPNPTENKGDETVDGATKSTILTSGPHGKFVSNTNACGRCHQLHAAQSSRLIRFKTDTTKNTIYGICTYCHSFNGQSTYDVRNGQIWDTNDGTRYATNGGGFENMLVVEGQPGVATYSKVTARHAVDISAGSSEPVKFIAPGGKQTDGAVQLKCTACHQPHGTANDRLLVESVEQGGDKYFSYAPGSVADGLGNTPTTGKGSFTGQTGAVKVVVENAFNDEKTNYNEKIIDFCSQCHVDYAAGATFDGSNFTLNDANGTDRPSRTANGKYEQKYRHMMNMKGTAGLNGDFKADNTYGFDGNNLLLPLATVGKTSGNGVVVCTTCHYAHGTFTNKNSGIKTYDEIDLGTQAVTAQYGPSGTHGKLNVLGGQETAKNLRLDDRGVCQNCHNRNPDQTLPSLIDVLAPGTVVTDTTIASANTLSGVKAKLVNNTVIIRFAQYMRATDVENPANYSIPGGTISAAKLQQDKRTVVLTVSGVTSGLTLTVQSGVTNTNSVPTTANITATIQ